MTQKPTYRDIVAADPSGLIAALATRIAALPQEAARSQEYADLGGYDSPYPRYEAQISHLIGLLKKSHADIGALRHHSHIWANGDYCQICGADGRA